MIFPKDVQRYEYELLVEFLDGREMFIPHRGLGRPSSSEWHVPARDKAHFRAYDVRRYGFSRGDTHYPAHTIRKVWVASAHDGEQFTVYPKWMWWKHR